MTAVGSLPIRERKVRSRPPRRRLRKQVAIATGALVVIWLAVGLLIQPMEIGPWSGFGDFESVPNNSFEHYDEVRYVHEQEGLLWASVRNNGPLPVTLTGVDWFPDCCHAILEQQDVHVILDDGRTTFGRLTADAHLLSEGPVRIGPDQTAFLAFVMRMDNCSPESVGGAYGVDRMTVRYQQLGIPRTTEILTHRPMWIASPDDCPLEPT